MELYILAQLVSVGLNRTEWIDIISHKSESHVREYAGKIKNVNPSAILGLRKLVEIELEI